MDRDGFWQSIEAARAEAPNNEDMLDALRICLEAMSADDVAAFQGHFDACMNELYRWDVWGAAYVMNGGCSDDGFAYWRAMLISLQRDREALFELASEGGLPDGGTGQLAGDLGVLNILLAGQIAEGLTEEAAVTARRILDMREDYDDDLLIEGSFVPDLMTHRALAVLGEEEQLRALGAKIVTAPGRIESPWNAWVYVAYAHVDLDAAVEMLLEQKAAHPRWIGTDDLALNVLRARDIITHPDMQAFYTAEGKWVDYLAARVPEYRVSVE